MGYVAGCCDVNNKPASSIKCEEVLEWLSNYSF
jgi:hypothetical protein